MGDVELPDFHKRYETLKQRHIDVLEHLGYDYRPGLEEREPFFFEAVEALKNMSLTDAEYLLTDAIERGDRILAEGAQGTLLDVDFGSYPFVTSSNTIAAGASTGLGIAPYHVKEVVGVFKAYCTRVGSGPFPTELNNEEGEAIRKAGHEFGATTGRPRRCGWIDLPALRYAVMINGVTQLMMMKADVLTGFDEIKICTKYRLPDGSTTDRMPFDLCKQEVEPIYETLPGWQLDSNKIPDNFEDLPTSLKEYVSYIEKYVKAPVAMVSLGPDRSQTIMKSDTPFS